jgi:hypothetical protein
MKVRQQENQKQETRFRVTQITGNSGTESAVNFTKRGFR